MAETVTAGVAPAPKAEVEAPKAEVEAPKAEVEAPKVEAPKAEATEVEAPKAEDRLTPRFRELARREKALVEKEREWKARESEHRALVEAKARLREDPTGALEVLGVRFDDLVQALLPKAPEAPVAAAERVARETVERGLAATRKAQEEAEAAEVDRVIAAAHERWGKEIDATPDFELVREQRAHGAVYQLIEDYFAQHGELLAVAQAAQIVEETLEEQVRAAASRVGKLRRLLGESAAAPSAPPVARAAPASAVPTLAGKAPPASAPAPAPPAQETREERIARIFAKIAG
jgi:hypothetical protein